METVYIYGLVDPRTNEIRYVGRTNNLKARYSGHLCESNQLPHLHKSKWLKQLLELNLKPGMIVLEETNEDNWQEAEKRWISKYKNNLTNLTDGGNHPVNKKGYKLSPEVREKIIKSLIGRKHSEETKRKISEAHKGLRYKLSDEARKNISLGHKGKFTGVNSSMFGRPVSQETRDKIRKANTGSKRSIETRQLMSMSAKLREERKRNKVLSIIDEIF